MKTLITVTNPELKQLLFSERCMALLSSVSEVHWAEEGQPYTADQLAADVPKYDAVITGWGSPKLTAAVLKHAQKLKFIGHTAGTVIPYVDEAAFQSGIMVVNANTALAYSTAELTIALMLAGTWNLRGYQMQMEAGNWKDNSETVIGLYGQKVGIIGLGEVSRQVIRLLRGFQADISLFSPYCSEEEAKELGVQRRSMEEILQTCSIISLHDTLTEETRSMIGEQQLAMIRDGSLLVNTARAPLIEEQALLKELQSGRISAALDVFHEEPPQASYPLFGLPNVIGVPHIGALSGYWKPRMGELVAEDLVRFANGEPVLRSISYEKFKRMTPL